MSGIEEQSQTDKYIIYIKQESHINNISEALT